MPRSSPVSDSNSGPFESLYAKGPSKKRRSGCLRVLAILVSVFVVLVAAVGIGGAIYYGAKALAYDMNKLNEVPERTLVYDKNQKLLGHVSGHGANRLVVSADEVSSHFVHALLAREDSRFYEHRGVDYVGVLRAVIGNLEQRSMDQGASTITMQLARNAFEMREKTLNRKFMEVALARRIERNYSKDEILAFYMNRIYFGSGLYGIERASQGFFMKPASELSLGEGAMLAGVIRGPSLLNPFRSIDDATDVRDEVLARMVADEVITEAVSNTAKDEAINLRPPNRRLATSSYALQTVYDLLASFLEDPDDVKFGGLRVYTTLDSELQEKAEIALDAHLESIETRAGFAHPPRSAHKNGTATRYLQGSVVTLDNRSGAIRVMVGGRNFADSSFNRAYKAKRQAGSTFKPFVYAVAMDRGGMLPGVYVSDDPIRLRHNGGPVWSPRNSDGTFTGLQPAAIGLIRSRNTMSIRVGQIAGLENVRSLAKTLYFGDLPDSPVVYLGAFETTPMTMTSAFSTLAAKGVNYTPHLIERIEHRDGRVLFPLDPRTKRPLPSPVSRQTVLPESVSWVTSDMLAKVMDEGTGRGARSKGFTAPAYGKTGTTNDYHDAWFVGYTDKLTTGVWVGLDQPKKIMEKGYGSTLALPVWTEVMKHADENGYPAEAIPPPTGTANTVLCRECGLLQSGRTRHPYQMPLPPEMNPRRSCRGHGGGLFTQNRNGLPQAFPIPGDPMAPPPPQFGPPPGESGFGRAIKNFGRALFGGGRQGDR